MSETTTERELFPRRTLLKVGAAGTAAVALGTTGSLIVPELRRRGLLSADGLFDAASIAWANVIYKEVYPTSPLIVTPVPGRAARAEGAGASADRRTTAAGGSRPGPGYDQQNSMGNQGHQIWPSQVGYPDPIVYKIDVKVNTHSFTSSQVLPINSFGQPTVSFDSTGKTYAAGTMRSLAAEHDLRLQRHVPGADDQRRVRQAVPGAVRQPPAREPATTSTARTSVRRTGRS